MASTLPELFAARRPGPEQPFLILAGAPALTYGDADRRSAQLANLLAAGGAVQGDRVAVQVEKSPLALLLYLACIRAGLVFVPMNPAYTALEVDHVLGDAEPSVVVREPTAELEAAAARHADRFDDVPVAPDDVAALLYTSGTTGRPKGAMLTHRNLASNAATLRDRWGFTPDDVLLHVLPVFHAHGLFVATNCVLANGTAMIFHERFDPARVVRDLPSATVFMGVPTHYSRLLAEPGFDRSACRDVRLFVSGSAPLAASTHEAFARATGHRILERYGMTETVMITSNPLDGERRPGTVGLPLDDVEVRLTSDGSPVAEGEVGDVEVRGPNVFAGYWRRPELMATEMTSDAFFRTGDLGRFDPDGYLHLVGRSKDLIISGGLNVYPAEVEAVLDGFAEVGECAVVGLPDADLGEVVVAVVVASAASAGAAGAAIDPEALRRRAREHLAPYKVPKRIEVVGALPRNAMGKVEKRRLREGLSGPR